MNADDEKLITRDWLAIERTKLANERTFLAYFRTAVVFLGTGFTILKLEFLSDITILGYLLMALGPAMFVFGFWRYLKVRQVIDRYYLR